MQKSDFFKVHLLTKICTISADIGDLSRFETHNEAIMLQKEKIIFFLILKKSNLRFFSEI